MTQTYVAGFLISDVIDPHVALILKNKPDWQRGKWNGIGGKVEAGEHHYDAMVREFEEEAGVRVEEWDYFAKHTGKWGSVFFYRAFVNFDVFKQIRTVEEEEVYPWDIYDLPDNVITNLNYLIPLAMERNYNYQPVVFKEYA